MRSARELAKEYGRSLDVDYPVADAAFEWLLTKQHADRTRTWNGSDIGYQKADFWELWSPDQKYGPDAEPKAAAIVEDEIAEVGDIVTWTQREKGFPVMTCAIPKLAADAIRADERKRIQEGR